VSFGANADEYRVGSWGAPFAWPAVAIHTHLLPNGKVLTFGRMPSGGVPVLWDPADPGVFQSTTQPGDLFCSGHSFLPDGRLIVAGGHAGADLYGTKTTFVYDAAGGWSQGPDMQNGPLYPTNTTLANGDVLTVSGTDTAALANRIPEVWQGSGWHRAHLGEPAGAALYPDDVRRPRRSGIHGRAGPAVGVGSTPSVTATGPMAR
jgi:hypothetical protein